MALSVTNRGTGTNNSGSTTLNLSPASNFGAGMAVLVMACDNNGTNGGAFASISVTDSLGNTWTRRQSPLHDPGNAGAGVEGAIFTTPQNGGVLQTGTTITITWSSSVNAKCWTLTQVSTNVGGASVVYVTGGVSTGSATASPTVTTGSIANGDVVLCGLFNEQGTGQTVTADSDTTNGSWSTMQTTEVGTTAGGMTVASQAKVVTSTATQTYNPTLGVSSDVILAWIQLHEFTITTHQRSAAASGTSAVATAGSFWTTLARSSAATASSLTAVAGTVTAAKRRAAAASVTSSVSSSGIAWTTFARSASASATSSVAATGAFWKVRSVAASAASGIATQATFWSTLSRSVAASGTTGASVSASSWTMFDAAVSASAASGIASQASFWTTFTRAVAASATSTIATIGAKLVNNQTLVRAASASAQSASSVIASFWTTFAALVSASASSSTSVSGTRRAAGVVSTGFTGIRRKFGLRRIGWAILRVPPTRRNR